MLSKKHTRIGRRSVMKKNESQPGVELIPSPAAIVRARTGIDKAELDLIVKQRVAEVMAARDAFIFEPFFRSRQIAYELKRLQTIPEQEKWSTYYERKGCLRCETRLEVHAGCGMCTHCYQRTFTELTQIVAEGMKGEPAKLARGAARSERHFGPDDARDGVRRTWYKGSNELEKLLCDRVAKQVGFEPSFVLLVARGKKHSESVSAALGQEMERLFKDES
jgi:hypothetical protein